MFLEEKSRIMKCRLADEATSVTWLGPTRSQMLHGPAGPGRPAAGRWPRHWSPSSHSPSLILVGRPRAHGNLHTGTPGPGGSARQWSDITRRACRDHDHGPSERLGFHPGRARPGPTQRPECPIYSDGTVESLTVTVTATVHRGRANHESRGMCHDLD